MKGIVGLPNFPGLALEPFSSPEEWRLLQAGRQELDNRSSSHIWPTRVPYCIQPLDSRYAPVISTSQTRVLRTFFFKALFGCAGPISLGVYFWCENSLPSILEW